LTDGVVLAHDYATQRGGAERVALLLAAAFPSSPLLTTLYEPATTFPEFADVDVRPAGLNRVGPLRRHHRAALPFLARAVDSVRVEADVLLASSTGWAHGFRGARRTVVYCHAPARWLYQSDRYLGARTAGGIADRARATVARAALAGLAPRLRAWDRRAAARADVYLANSTVTRDAVRAAYGIEAEVVPPPPCLLPAGEETPLLGVRPGFLLCVARLLPYKNVDVVVGAAARTGRHLVVVGDGPDRARLESAAARLAPGRVTFTGRVADGTLRWLYRNADLLVAASYEDYGLTPLEAGAFGTPVVALRDGGYLDTVAEGVNGVFFDHPLADEVAAAIDVATAASWDAAAVRAHVDRFGADRFVARLQTVVAEQQDVASSTLEGSVA
jgi:glycosyltransferase involved in cell wall biosynthesis